MPVLSLVLSGSTAGASTASLGKLSQLVISLSWGKNKNSFLDVINHLKLRLFPFFSFFSFFLHCVPLQLVWLSLLFLLSPDIDKIL